MPSFFTFSGAKSRRISAKAFTQLVSRVSGVGNPKEEDEMTAQPRVLFRRPPRECCERRLKLIAVKCSGKWNLSIKSFFIRSPLSVATQSRWFMALVKRWVPAQVLLESDSTNRATSSPISSIALSTRSESGKPQAATAELRRMKNLNGNG